MTNKLVCHQEGNSPYILLHVSIQGQTAHLAQHPNDFVPSGPTCERGETTTTVVVTTAPPTTTATIPVPTSGVPTTNVVTDSTTPSQIDTQVLAASTAAVPGPVAFNGPLPQTGGADIGGGLLVAAAVTVAGGLLWLSSKVGKAWRS